MDHHKVIKKELDSDIEYQGDFMEVIKDEFPIYVQQDEFTQASLVRQCNKSETVQSSDNVFQCNFCGKRFTKKGYFIKHLKIHKVG